MPRRPSAASHQPATQPVAQPATPGPDASRAPVGRALPPVRRTGLSLALGLALATATALPGRPAQAQASAPSAAAAPKAYAIPAGPLDEALNRFARSAGVLLSFDPALAEGRRSPGLNGRYGVDDGFAALLAGTSLHAQAQADGSYAVGSGPSAAPVMPDIKVKARGDALTSEGTGRYGMRASNTATRLALSPRETPQSISVVTREQMDDFGLQSVNDVLANTTGVNVDVVESDRTYFSSRGFDISNFQVDGVGMPFTNGDQLGDIDTAPYDRIEVLRGANGLLSSTGNPSATVNYVRKRPTPTFQASAGLTVGSWDKRRLDADVAGPLNSAGSVRGRLVAAKQRNESFMDNYQLDKTVVAGVLEADFGERTVLTGGVTHQRNRPEGTSWGGLPLNFSDGTPTDYDRSTAVAPRWSHWNNDDTTTFVELTRQLGGEWQAKAVLSHRKLESDGELFSISGDLPNRTTGLGTTVWASTQVADETQTLFDVYATGPFTLGGRRHDLVVGANRAKVRNEASYQRGDSNGDALVAPGDWGSLPRPVFDGAVGEADFINRRETLYALARWHLSEPWKLMTGLNATRMESEGLGFRGVPREYDETKVVPYLGSTFAFDAHHSLYASYTKIFNPQTQVDADQQLLGPVEGQSVEAGVKGEWLDQRLNATLAVFRTEQDNTAEFVEFVDLGEQGGFNAYRGIDATSTGFELDVAGQITPGWALSGGYTQLRLKDADGNDARTFVPRRTFRLATSYRVPALPGLKLGATVRWQSDIERINANVAPDTTETVRRRQGSYALLGLMARYDFSDHLSTTLVINNVTDKTHLASLYWDQSLYGAPRHATLALNWRY